MRKIFSLRNLCLYIVLVFHYSNIKAQIQVTQLPSFGASYSTNDVFNVAIVSQISQPVSIQIHAVITSETGAQVATLLSKPVTIKPGINQFNYLAIDNSKTIFQDASLQQFEYLYKSLPKGNYNVCVRVRCYDSECGKFFQDIDYKYCNNFIAQPFIPLLLISPKDDEEIELVRPTLTWSVPMGSNMTSLRYSLKLVEVHSDQAPGGAVAANVPIINQENITFNILSYPVQAESLTPGKKYAWQVIAFNDNQTIASSEVWTFNVKVNAEEVLTNNFVSLQDELSSSFINVSNYKLGIQFNERFSAGDFDCIIYNDQGPLLNFSLLDIADSSSLKDLKEKKKKPLREGASVKKLGENQYLLDLKDCKLTEGFYILEAHNKKNEKYYLRFKL